MKIIITDNNGNKETLSNANISLDLLQATYHLKVVAETGEWGKRFDLNNIQNIQVVR